MKYELEIRNFYKREGKLRLIFQIFYVDGNFNLMGGTAEYVGKPETQIEFGYNGQVLYKSKNNFPSLKTILNNILKTI